MSLDSILIVFNYYVISSILHIHIWNLWDLKVFYFPPCSTVCESSFCFVKSSLIPSKCGWPIVCHKEMSLPQGIVNAEVRSYCSSENERKKEKVTSQSYFKYGWKYKTKYSWFNPWALLYTVHGKPFLAVLYMFLLHHKWFTLLTMYKIERKGLWVCVVEVVVNKLFKISI